jgi:hypothetical protein
VEVYNLVEMIRNIHKQQKVMAHAYNPSYWGGRDREDHSSRLAWEKS